MAFVVLSHNGPGGNRGFSSYFAITRATIQSGSQRHSAHKQSHLPWEINTATLRRSARTIRRAASSGLQQPGHVKVVDVRHRRLHEARADGRDGHPLPPQLDSQPFEVDIQRRLACTIGRLPRQALVRRQAGDGRHVSLLAASISGITASRA